MPGSAFESRPKADTELRRGSPDVTNSPLDPDEVLSVLSDAYSRDILQAIGDGSLPAREIATRLDISRPTVYRRLNRLEELGIVETSMEYDSDGHHRKRFHVVFDRIMLSFDEGQIRIDRTA